tara:strand:- start:46 stop:411 length:366 start_codon:yes stop_codon:yes gene_type:complete
MLRVSKLNGWYSPNGVRTNSTIGNIQGFEWHDDDMIYRTYSFVPDNVIGPNYHTILVNVKNKIRSEEPNDENIDRLFKILRFMNKSNTRNLECFKLDFEEEEEIEEEDYDEAEYEEDYDEE